VAWAAVAVAKRGAGETVLIPNVRITAVPEPATWAMMILGFGAAGSVLRRRRAAVAGALA